jgi:hypothetical protein
VRPSFGTRAQDGCFADLTFSAASALTIDSPILFFTSARASGSAAAILPSASTARARTSGDFESLSASSSAFEPDSASTSPSAKAAIARTPSSLSAPSRLPSGATAPSSPMRPAASAARLRTAALSSARSLPKSDSSQRRSSSACMIRSSVSVGTRAAARFFGASPAVLRAGFAA